MKRRSEFGDEVADCHDDDVLKYSALSTQRVTDVVSPVDGAFIAADVVGWTSPVEMIKRRASSDGSHSSQSPTHADSRSKNVSVDQVLQTSSVASPRAAETTAVTAATSSVQDSTVTTTTTGVPAVDVGAQSLSANVFSRLQNAMTGMAKHGLRPRPKSSRTLSVGGDSDAAKALQSTAAAVAKKA